MVNAIVTPHEMSRPSSRSRLVFVAAAFFVLTVGAVLRIYHLGDRSLWFDEALTANTSRGTLAHMIEATRLRGSAPVVHPYILYVVEKVGKTAVAVRAPSVIASLLSLIVMLAMVRTKLNRSGVLFAVAVFAVSASQVRYAQEVREYALGVFFATTLIYCLLKWEASGLKDDHPMAAAALSTMVLRIVLERETCFRLRHVAIGTAALASGGFLSFLLTLRYQFQPGRGQWYLVSNYFDRRTTTIWHFLITNFKGLLSFLIPGQIVTACFAIAVIVFCVSHLIRRKFDTLMLLVFTSVGITVCMSLVDLYPFGGIRQCLFLAPGIVLFAGVVFADVIQQFADAWQPLTTVAIFVLILLSGYRGMRRQWPYGEYEDTKSILEELKKTSAPSDEVWVNHDAVEAVDFYLQGKDRRFVYGTYHKDPNEYIPEVAQEIDPHRQRVWLIFSHLEQPSDDIEEQLIVNSLQPGWDVESVITPVNTHLFVAQKRPAPQAIASLTKRMRSVSHAH